MAQTKSSSRFMVNILKESKDRTTYVPALKSVSPDARVSYSRLLLSIAFLAIVIIVALWSLSRDWSKFGYVLVPILLMVIGSLIVIVVFAVSSREKSMLSSVFDYLTFETFELERRRRGHTLKGVTVGIMSCEDMLMSIGRRGLLTFDNGDVGVMYKVEGQLSFSVLPAVVQALKNYKAQYLVSRTSSAHEYLITSIQKATVDKQLGYLKAVYDNPESTEFSRNIADITHKYVEDVAKTQTQIVQYIILRNTDQPALERDVKNLESMVRQGLYAELMPLGTRDIVDALAPLTMTSTRGKETFVSSAAAQA